MRVLIAVMALATCALAQSEKQVADVVFVNGHAVGPNVAHMFLQTPASDDEVQVQAIAVKNGKILTLSDDRHVRDVIGPKTQVIDLHGKYIAAGFNDAHTHIEEAGLEKLNVNLLGTTSLEDMLS